MIKKSIQFSTAKTNFYFDANTNLLHSIAAKRNVIIITDENVFSHHSKKFKKIKTIVIKPGEEYKNQSTADTIIQQLIDLQADRNTLLVGIGGGVVTDVTGYVASTYMRGLAFGFIPTSILAMVDAAIGGKNGIDVGPYKNMVGIIRQPEFLLYDTSYLKTLPLQEWQNGFAEIIKHAAIKSKKMFTELEHCSIPFYQKNKSILTDLIYQNAMIKIKVVQADEFEKGERKLLNFGHTIGHAIEKMQNLPHGFAISIGMVYAGLISNKLTGFKNTEALIEVFEKYGLPTKLIKDTKPMFSILTMDKKKDKRSINYIVLKKIGEGAVVNLPFSELQTIIEAI